LVQFVSQSLGRILHTQVTHVNAKNEVQLKCKPGVWMSVDEQRKKITRNTRPVEKLRSHVTMKVDDLDDKAKQTYYNLQKLLEADGNESLAIVASENFKKFDQNQDGQIDFGEFIRLCTAVHQQLRLTPPTEDVVRDLFDSVDEDSSGELELCEFEQGFRRLVRNTLAKFKLLELQDLVRSTRRCFFDRYTVERQLAAGAMGVTYLAIQKSSKMKVVVKAPKNNTDREDFDAIKNIAHPNIVRVLELFTSIEGKVYIVMELCNGKDLFAALLYCQQNRFQITFQFLASMMKQSMTGVNFLHQGNGICHNDLKPENILLDRLVTAEDLRAKVYPRCMIADFGCATAVGQPSTGDPRYKAPEYFMYNVKKATRSGDVWALGVTMFELLSGGRLVFTNARNVSGWEAFVKTNGGALYQQFIANMKNVQAEPTWTEIRGSSQAEDLCRKLLTRQQAERIKLPKASQHPWFNSLMQEESAGLSPEVLDQLARRAELSEMKVALLNMVASKLTGENLQHFADLWKRFDLDASGYITEDEFVKVMAETEHMDHAHARELFQLHDVDTNGNMNFNEFVGLMFNADTLSPETLEELFRSTFIAATSSGNKLCLEQFIDRFPTANPGQRTAVNNLFKEIDRGGEGWINKDDFCKFLAEM